MFSKFLSELFFLAIIIFVCSRFLYINKLQFDPLSALAVLVWPLSLLLIFAWGFSSVTAFIFVISFFVMLWNLRSFSRYRQKLAFDHYSLWFIGTSLLNLFLCLFVFIVLCIYHPVPQQLKKNNIVTETTTYIGDFKNGFKETQTPFRKRNAILTSYYYYKEEMDAVPQELLDKVAEQKIFKSKAERAREKAAAQKNAETAATPASGTVIYSKAPEEEVKEVAEESSEDNSRKIILFLPNKAANPEYYIPLFKELTKSGFTVYTAEFYTKDQRWFKNILDWRIFRHKFVQYKQLLNLDKLDFSEKTEYYENELTQLLKFVTPRREDTIYMVGDKDSSAALQNVHNNNFSLIDAYYDISTISAYSTPGYGFIEQQDPLLAKKFNIKRESSNIYVASVATILLNELEFNGQLNSFTLQQRENEYGSDENNYQGFSAEATGTVEIEAPELELE